MIILVVIFCLLLFVAFAVALSPLRTTWQPSMRRPILLVFISTAAAASTLYLLVGSPLIIDAIAVRDEKMTALKNEIQVYAQTVKSNPKDQNAWVMLGQAFLETGQFSAASNAFRQSVLLSNGHPMLLLAYAKSLVLAADGTVTDDAKKALEMVLLQDKQNPDARYFMALYNLQKGNMPEAMRAMKALYHELPDDSPLKATINRQIGRN
jgi:cytochrome c-type biogenesis protein CcmH